MNPLRWGELRSQLSTCLAHDEPDDLWSILELLEDTQEQEQGLGYVRDHLERLDDRQKMLARFELLLKDAPRLRQLCAQAHEAPRRVDLLLWFVLNHAEPQLISAIAQTLLERSRAHSPIFMKDEDEDEDEDGEGETREHELELALLVRWIVDGEPALGERITRYHQCEPGLWRQFLCAWVWSVVDDPTSSPSLSLDGPSNTWQVKAWPNDYGDDGLITSEGWQIVVDEDDSETLSHIDLSQWPGIDGQDDEREDDD